MTLTVERPTVAVDPDAPLGCAARCTLDWVKQSCPVHSPAEPPPVQGPADGHCPRFYDGFAVDDDCPIHGIGSGRWPARYRWDPDTALWVRRGHARRAVDPWWDASQVGGPEQRAMALADAGWDPAERRYP